MASEVVVVEVQMVLMPPGHVQVQLIHVCNICSTHPEEDASVYMYYFQHLVKAVDHIQ